MLLDMSVSAQGVELSYDIYVSISVLIMETFAKLTRFHLIPIVLLL